MKRDRTIKVRSLFCSQIERPTRTPGPRSKAWRRGPYQSNLVELLADEYGWSSSVPNLSGKLRRGSLRYTEAVELADVLGYDLVWVKRREVR